MQDAVFLGGVVTVTHTASVYLLGLVAVVAAAYLVPETVHQGLEIVSGLLILTVGLWMIKSRVLTRGSNAESEHSHDYGHSHSHSSGLNQEHQNGHSHEHAPGSGKPRLRELLTLGISGGVVPCPAALATLLAAISIGTLDNVAGALAMVVIFSLGLAVVLIAIGITMVKASGFARSRLNISSSLASRAVLELLR